MDPVMYLVMASPSVTPMSPGKLAAQAAHAAVEAYLISDQNKQAVNRWRCGGHYKKVVLMTDDLGVASRYIQDRGFKVACIIDEGRTEFTADLTMTAIGVEILDKDELHVRETFGAFKLYTPGNADVPAPASLGHPERIIHRWGRGRPPWRRTKGKLWDGRESPPSSSNNPEAYIVY